MQEFIATQNIYASFYITSSNFFLFFKITCSIKWVTRKLKRTEYMLANQHSCKSNAKRTVVIASL